ncbi:hypothetical protein [Oscillospiraceae bacterium]|nr:hypothetical protein [Oscillospiraceae bacterium]
MLQPRGAHFDRIRQYYDVFLPKCLYFVEFCRQEVLYF